MTVVALVLAAVSAAGAADDDSIARGLDLRKEGRDQEALPLFVRAVKEHGAPRAYGQLGTCEQALGLWVGAEAHISEALAHPQDPWVAKNEAALKVALGYIQERLGSIDVWGTPGGARVNIDGESVGVLPLGRPARVAIGQRRLVVEASGYQPERRAIDVGAGALIREHVVLQAVAVGDKVRLDAIPTDSGGHPPSPDPATPSSDQVAEEPALYQRWWFWVAVGAVAVAAGGTAYYFATRNDGCQAPMGGTCTTF